MKVGKVADRINAMVMKGQRLADIMNAEAVSVDAKRMFFGGFTVRSTCSPQAA